MSPNGSTCRGVFGVAGGFGQRTESRKSLELWKLAKDGKDHNGICFGHEVEPGLAESPGFHAKSAGAYQFPGFERIGLDAGSAAVEQAENADFAKSIRPLIRRLGKDSANGRC